MFERFVERRAEEALSDTPVVLIVGPRRAGKTTLVRKMGEAGRTYITLDDQTVLEAAHSDPAGFIRGLDRAIIDEIQRAPNLLLAIGDRLAAMPLSSLWNGAPRTIKADKSR
jgi:predicted AAA+ superfamily ATPase